MSDFAPASDHCRAAYDLVASGLPTGFIAPGFLVAWTDYIRSGKGGSRGSEFVRLLALLPPAGGWPELNPICARLPGEGDPALFLRTLDHRAFAVGRASRDRNVAGSMPLRRFAAVEDRATCPEHAALNGTVRRQDDPFWTSFDLSLWWGCRCTSTVMNERTALRRGFLLPS